MQKLDAATSSLERALAASGAVDSAHKSYRTLGEQDREQLRDVKRAPGMLTQGGQGAAWPPWPHDSIGFPPASR